MYGIYGSTLTIKQKPQILASIYHTYGSVMGIFHRGYGGHGCEIRVSPVENGFLGLPLLIKISHPVGDAGFRNHPQQHRDF